MFRIRFHGRGGQGIKSASRVLGTAFFRSGFEVQDAPRYDAKRRGAPIEAYVRAAREPIHERGIIARPDLIVVADTTLVTVPAAGIHEGVTSDTVMLVASSAPTQTWQERLPVAGPIVALPESDALRESDPALVGIACAGGAARLTGVIERITLDAAIREEVESLGAHAVAQSLRVALAAFDALLPHHGMVVEHDTGSTADHPDPEWIDLSLDNAKRATPAIFNPATSERTHTGAWRIMRPVIDYAHCNRCAWMCGTRCPDGAIKIGADHISSIDYDHCKGCMVCVTVCPPHAIRAVAERDGSLLLRDIR